MHCTNCGSVLDPGAKFCPACGHSVLASVGGVSAPLPTNRLVRPREGRRIAGVCVAISKSLNWDVTLVRVLWILLVFGAGTGLIAYFIAWIVIPNEV